MTYSTTLMDHYQSPRNVGAFNPDDACVGTALVGSPAQGDVIKLQVKFDTEGTITDTRFKTYGCAATIAASSWVSEWLKGKTAQQALAFGNQQITEALQLPPLKIHCSMLAEEAVRAAVKNFHDKQG